MAIAWLMRLRTWSSGVTPTSPLSNSSSLRLILCRYSIAVMDGMVASGVNGCAAGAFCWATCLSHFFVDTPFTSASGFAAFSRVSPVVVSVAFSGAFGVDFSS